MRHLGDPVLMTCLAASLAANVYLAARPHQHQDADLRPPPPKLQPGRKAPPLTLRGADGRVAVFNYGDAATPTVLYVVSPTCSWCSRNWDNVRELIAKTQGRFRFVAISLDRENAAQYVRDAGVDMPVYTQPEQQSVAAYGLAGTPHTIVVSPDGVVLQNWPGAYTGRIQQEVQQFFGIPLPGVATSQGSRGCVDSGGLEYSEGAVLTAAGKRKRCSGGVWRDM